MLRRTVEEKERNSVFQTKCLVYETLFSLGFIFIPSNRMFGKLQLPTGELNIEIYANPVGSALSFTAARWEEGRLVEDAFETFVWDEVSEIKERATNFVKKNLDSCEEFFDAFQRQQQGIWYESPSFPTAPLHILVKDRIKELQKELQGKFKEIGEILTEAGFKKVLDLSEVQVYDLIVGCFKYSVSVRANTIKVSNPWNTLALLPCSTDGAKRAIEIVEESVESL